MQTGKLPMNNANSWLQTCEDAFVCVYPCTIKDKTLGNVAILYRQSTTSAHVQVQVQQTINIQLDYNFYCMRTCTRNVCVCVPMLAN